MAQTYQFQILDCIAFNYFSTSFVFNYNSSCCKIVLFMNVIYLTVNMVQKYLTLYIKKTDLKTSYIVICEEYYLLTAMDHYEN